MSEQYTAVTAISWMALAVLCILVHENDRIEPAAKRHYYLTYALIALSALAEWLGVLIGGNTRIPVWVLRLVKCADYILTPMAGVAFAMQLGQRNIWRKLLLGILAANTLLQIVACFGDRMLTIDAEHRYTHGPLYPVYTAIYLLVIALVLVEFIRYGRSFRRQNRASLFSIIFLVLIGIAAQEIFDGVRTSYIALTLGAALLYIHFTEFVQLVTDDVVTQQMIEITTDPLTGLHNRNAYSEQLRRYRTEGVPADLAVFLIDINGLKAVNDALGHEAGDDLICGAAECIRSALGPAYRIGGDEFVVMASMDRAQADEALARLELAAQSWRGWRVDTLGVSAGYALAAEHPGVSAEALAREADREMYQAKARYYREAGLSRSRRFDCEFD